jgi:hypothetical protein
MMMKAKMIISEKTLELKLLINLTTLMIKILNYVLMDVKLSLIPVLIFSMDLLI